MIPSVACEQTSARPADGGPSALPGPGLPSHADDVTATTSTRRVLGDAAAVATVL